MKRFKPFSNATEASYWFDKNCEVCKTSKGCSGKMNIEYGFWLGDISMRSANLIGIENDRIIDTCQMKDKREIKKRSVETNLTLEL